MQAHLKEILKVLGEDLEREGLKKTSERVAQSLSYLTRAAEQPLDLQTHVKEILKLLGEDPEREGLKKTPERVAKSLRDLTSGAQQSLESLINGAFFSSKITEMILVKDIEFHSLCEHHLLPFMGHCHIAYIPNGKIIGLSKVPRLVDFYARRLQIQENLTVQIADLLMDLLNAKGVAVIMEAKHLCMMIRGVEKKTALLKTSVMLGAFREDLRTRSEFLSLLG